MASKFTELCVDCSDVELVGRFWSQVLGYEMDGPDEDGLVELKAPAGAGPHLVFIKVPENKTVKNRLHIDVNATDRSQAEEVERLLGLGATYADVGQGDDVSWVVMADPEGNEFCVLRSRQDPANQQTG
jgi:Glyoxalase-like domain